MVCDRFWFAVDRVADCGLLVVDFISHACCCVVDQKSQTAMSNEEQLDDSPTPQPLRKLSCAKCFDALWFCYSPVHQMQQYYRIGVLDNCAGKWSSLMDCLTLKTKSNRQVSEILETREKERTHIWTFRTPEEASTRWREIYGDPDDLN